MFRPIHVVGVLYDEVTKDPFEKKRKLDKQTQFDWASYNCWLS